MTIIQKGCVKVGLFGIGLAAYWDQFQGLEARLKAYLAEVETKMTRQDVEIVNLGMIDSTDKAFEAGDRFREEGVTLIFLYVSTYALSSTVLQVVSKSKVPVIVLNLSPAPAIDYASFNQLNDRMKMTGEWLAFCAACPVPEIANVFKRACIPFFQITGTLHHDAVVWQEVKEWMDAAGVAHTLSYNRLGLMGHYYGGMLDIYTDLTLQLSVFGGHMEMIEVDELSRERKDVTPEQINKKLREFEQSFEVQADCSTAELARAAKTAVALDILVKKHKLGSMAYYYKGTGSADNEDTMSSIILGNSLLTAQGIPVAGEYEVKNAQAMKIMDCLGAGGSFTEYYAMDFVDDIVLMGHDGPCHPKIAEGKIKVKPLKAYHGKVGNGLSVEMSVRHGEVTLLSVVETAQAKIIFLIAEGVSVPGPILEIGNTNSRYQFPCGARAFVESWNSHGPAHHCAIGKGHISATLIKLAQILDIGYIQVC